MNDNRRKDAELIQQALDMKLTLNELLELLAKRPRTYAPLRALVEIKREELK
jgi:hypothetical protein